MAGKLTEITHIHRTLQKLFVGTGVPGGSVAGSSSHGHRGASIRLQQCEEECSERERGTAYCRSDDLAAAVNVLWCSDTRLRLSLVPRGCCTTSYCGGRGGVVGGVCVSV